jgi:hypothetical protein
MSMAARKDTKGRLVGLGVTDEGGSAEFTRAITVSGNSKGVTIPADLLDALGVDVGDLVRVIIISPAD